MALPIFAAIVRAVITAVEVIDAINTVSEMTRGNDTDSPDDDVGMTQDAATGEWVHGEAGDGDIEASLQTQYGDDFNAQVAVIDSADFDNQENQAIDRLAEIEASDAETLIGASDVEEPEPGSPESAGALHDGSEAAGENEQSVSWNDLGVGAKTDGDSGDDAGTGGSLSADGSESAVVVSAEPLSGATADDDEGGAVVLADAQSVTGNFLKDDVVSLSGQAPQSDEDFETDFYFVDSDYFTGESDGQYFGGAITLGTIAESAEAAGDFESADDTLGDSPESIGVFDVDGGFESAGDDDPTNPVEDSEDEHSDDALVGAEGDLFDSLADAQSQINPFTPGDEILDSVFEMGEDLIWNN